MKTADLANLETTIRQYANTFGILPVMLRVNQGINDSVYHGAERVNHLSEDFVGDFNAFVNRWIEINQQSSHAPLTLGK